MKKVVLLEPRERIGRDLERLLAVGGLQSSGPSGAVDIAMEELAETLSRLAVAYRDRRLDEVSRTARYVADQARDLGLNRAFRVGHTVAILAGGDDGVALAANVARLMRLGDVALTSVWDKSDQCE